MDATSMPFRIPCTVACLTSSSWYVTIVVMLMKPQQSKEVNGYDEDGDN